MPFKETLAVIGQMKFQKLLLVGSTLLIALQLAACIGHGKDGVVASAAKLSQGKH